ncbi:MAG: DNA mismatch repair protein MutS [Bacteroidota bacterium]
MPKTTPEPSAAAPQTKEQASLFPLPADKKKRAGATPLMRQYWKIKDRHPGALLLFRMGDFYETFERDAEVVADVLGITLTKRGNGAAEDIPLAGFPHHALETHLPKLVSAGHRVAVCEQLEDAKFARKIVKRDVVEVVTPGVAMRDQLLSAKHAHYLAAAVWGTTKRTKGRVGFAFVDASTGAFFVAEAAAADFEGLLQTVGPAELLIDKRQKKQLQALRDTSFALTPQEDWVFSYDFAYETLLRHFETHSLKGYGFEDEGPTGADALAITAAGAALYYLGETQKGRVPHVRRLQRYDASDYIALDAATKRNLELVATMQGRRDGSLVSILDHTLTPMGGRLLRAWLVRPLQSVEKIEQRLDAVDALVQSERLRRNLREELRQVGDLERLAAKVCTGRATPRDLVTLKLTLRQIPPVKQLLEDVASETLAKVTAALTLCQDTVERIHTALSDEPPAKMDAGGTIRAGFSDELDDLRTVSKGGKTYLAELQARAAAETGITSLKIGYNKVFGYYLEVTNTHKDKVPVAWTRKQTLVNAERYITEDLKVYEEKILTAEERALALEQQLFAELRMAVAEAVEPIQRNARYLAMLDVFAGLAEAARKYDYVRPTVDDSRVLDLEAARHPVVERTLPAGEAFIPNSVLLDPDQQVAADPARGGQLHVITGPNMAGKSVVLRQVGLAVLLAQVGSFVPAKRARIGVVDKIFTRVGASDNLAAGESTFLVEMNETANILNNATPRSLILLDEVGRGTSTFDGLSIAWAIVEHLHDHAPVAARTLFATHYHELNALADRLGGVLPFRIQVQEHEGRVIFLRTLIPGGADHSYGIEVARMAGLPEAVIARAKQVLAHLEAHDVAAEMQRPEHVSDGAMPSVRTAAHVTTGVPAAEHTAPVACAAPDPIAARVLDTLDALDPNRLTPIEALMRLAELKQIADG